MLPELARLLVRWRSVFPRHITWVRAIAVLLGLIIATGRRTVTASIVARGGQDRSWAPDYLVFSRALWAVKDLFDAVLTTFVETLNQMCLGGPLVFAVDDTGVHKTGKTIAAAGWLRDPQSPPFHLNLIWGLRYLHIAAILPFHQMGLDPRAVSVLFEPAPAIKKPGKKATAEQIAGYMQVKKEHNLSQIAVRAFKHLRDHLDKIGYRLRSVLLVTDSSYLNHTVLAGLPERVHLIGRARSDMAICTPAPEGGRKVYGDRLPTPEAIRQDPERPWSTTELHYAGSKRVVRYKELSNVLWQRGGKRRPLRLLIVAPTPYRAPGKGRHRMYYRDPAYLLTTDLTTPAKQLLQAYLDRWQIEVEHRDLKTGLGVGQAQVHNDLSVARLHSAHVAMWSMVKLAALRTHGPLRTEAYPPRPAWYPQEPDDRPSQQDIVEALRAEVEAIQSLMKFDEGLPAPQAIPQGCRPYLLCQESLLDGL